MGSGPPPWTLQGFLECLDVWSHLESPSQDLKLLVTAWIMSRLEDPYQGVRRAEGFSNLWFGAVPNSQHSAVVVACSYWIEEESRTVRCDSLATLSLPL